MIGIILIVVMAIFAFTALLLRNRSVSYTDGFTVRITSRESIEVSRDDFECVIGSEVMADGKTVCLFQDQIYPLETDETLGRAALAAAAKSLRNTGLIVEVV